MADITGEFATGNVNQPHPAMRTLDEARALARERFKTKLQSGEKIGECACGAEDDVPAAVGSQDAAATGVVGIRFRDSGRTYYFAPGQHSLAVNDWVVVETSRGREAGRVVIAPHQVRLNLLQGELRPILRLLGDDDVQRMEALKRDAANAVKMLGKKIRERQLPMKPISAEYNFDGSQLTLHFSSPDRVDFRDLARDLSSTFHCRVDLRQVGPRDEARLLGGLGRCGRTLCCSSWLPVFPDISMNMAKTQDLPLNPGKVSGVCGRLLCCLSYENEQYRQMKVVLPRLGQAIETPRGPGMVVSLQVLKELVTVRLTADNSDAVFSSGELDLGKSPTATNETVSLPATDVADVGAAPPDNATETASSGGGSRRRGRRRGRASSQPADGALSR